MSSVSEIVQRVVVLESNCTTIILAIDGLGGAGKTHLTCAMGHALGDIGRRVEFVHFDDFYLPSAVRPTEEGGQRPIGGNYDWPRLRDQVLLPLREERVARFARYDWTQDALTERREISPGGIVIIEGVYTSRRELAHLYDLRVWVECPRHLRLRRGIARDGEAGRARWEFDWMPAEDRYVEEHRPHESADMVVSGAST